MVTRFITFLYETIVMKNVSQSELGSVYISIELLRRQNEFMKYK